MYSYNTWSSFRLFFSTYGFTYFLMVSGINSAAAILFNNLNAILLVSSYNWRDTIFVYYIHFQPPIKDTSGKKNILHYNNVYNDVIMTL